MDKEKKAEAIKIVMTPKMKEVFLKISEIHEELLNETFERIVINEIDSKIGKNKELMHDMGNILTKTEELNLSLSTIKQIEEKHYVAKEEHGKYECLSKELSEDQGGQLNDR